MVELILTNPLTWKLVGGLAGLLGLNRYFRIDRRAKRADLYARLAKSVLAIVVDRKGLSPRDASVAADSIDQLKELLVREGVKRRNAASIAERLLAAEALEVSLKAGSSPGPSPPSPSQPEV